MCRFKISAIHFRLKLNLFVLNLNDDTRPFSVKIRKGSVVPVLQVGPLPERTLPVGGLPVRRRTPLTVVGMTCRYPTVSVVTLMFVSDSFYRGP